MTPLILLIEGKRAERPSFLAGLTKKGFRVESVPNGIEALLMLEKQTPKAVVIDAASMRTTGTRICADVRKKFRKMSIFLILSEKQMVEANNCADEILIMPFTIQKLLNRLKPYIYSNQNKILEVGPIKLDLDQHWVYCKGKKERLTPRLFNLMEMLMRNPGVVIEREVLFIKLWETEYLGDTRSLDVHISWLRKAVERDPRNPVYIKTERGVGYRLEVDKPSRPKPEKDLQDEKEVWS
jgi:DNA-binding response OmpR family regulator